MTRRRVLAVLAALPAYARRAAAAPPTVEVLDGEASTTGDVIAVTGERIAVHRTLRATVRAIDSIANANDRYQVELVLHVQPRGEAWLLDTAGRAVRWRSMTEGTWTSTWFDVDRATADRFASASGITRRDRRPQIDGITGHWSAPTTASLAQPIVVSVVVGNVGNAPVTVSYGPLGASFRCTVPGIPAIEGLYTGPLAIRELAPGTSFTFTADLRHHAKLGSGTHDVACELALEAFTGPQYPARPSDRWDAPLLGTARITVQ